MFQEYLQQKLKEEQEIRYAFDAITSYLLYWRKIETLMLSAICATHATVPHGWLIKDPNVLSICPVYSKFVLTNLTIIPLDNFTTSLIVTLF